MVWVQNHCILSISMLGNPLKRSVSPRISGEKGNWGFVYPHSRPDRPSSRFLYLASLHCSLQTRKGVQWITNLSINPIINTIKRIFAGQSTRDEFVIRFYRLVNSFRDKKNVDNCGEAENSGCEIWTMGCDRSVRKKGGKSHWLCHFHSSIYSWSLPYKWVKKRAIVSPFCSLASLAARLWMVTKQLVV